MCIKVNQGEESKTFPVYHGVVCYYSKFFDRALNGPFKEGGAETLEIEDCTIATFEMFFNWMNTGVASKASGETFRERDALDLFVFADFYDIPALYNRSMELYVLAALKNPCIDTDIIFSIFEQTTDRSPIREVAITNLLVTSDFSSLKEFDQSPEILMSILEKSHQCRFVPGADKVSTTLHQACLSSYNNIGVQHTDKQWLEIQKEHFCGVFHIHNDPI